MRRANGVLEYTGIWGGLRFMFSFDIFLKMCFCCYCFCFVFSGLMFFFEAG